jgi:holin-like protein
MKILFQLFILILFTVIGEWISMLLPFKFPGSLIGLILLFLALLLKVIKVDYIKDVSTFLQKYMAFLFVPLAVGLMQYFNLIALHWLELVLVLIVSTTVTLIVTSVLAQRGIKDE